MKKLLLIFTLFISNLLFANEVQIKKVKAKCNENRVCTFNVTLKHKDTGWKHYANKWEVYSAKGKLLGTRVLHHPHVKEQPFTRSLKIKIPKNVKKVFIKAYDSKHGTSKKIYKYNLNL